MIILMVTGHGNVFRVLAEERAHSDLAVPRSAEDSNALETGDRLNSFLLPHPDDSVSSDGEIWGYSFSHDGHMYVATQIRMAIWIALLVSGYFVERTTCSLGYPQDCLRKLDYYEIFSDMTSLALYGIALGWFVSITAPFRWHWIMNRWVVFMIQIWT